MTREDAMEQYINLLSDNTLKGVEDDHSSVSDVSLSIITPKVGNSPFPSAIFGLLISDCCYAISES